MSQRTYICELGNLKMTNCFWNGSHILHTISDVPTRLANRICLKGFDILYGCKNLDRETLSFVCGGSNDDTPLLRVAVPCRPACRRNTSSAWPNSRRRCGPSVTSRGT